VATTGIGFRGWVEAAEGWGLGRRLLDALGSGTLIARGPKARGAIRATGLSDAWSPASESSAEVLEHLLDEGVEGRRIAVQLHGEPLPDVVESLTMAGAEVVEVPVYRWAARRHRPARPPDRRRARGRRGRRCVHQRPAAASLLRRAGERGVLDELLTAARPGSGTLRRAVTAAPLEALDVPTVQPHRSRLGAMVRRLEGEMPARARSLPVAGHWLELRGQAAIVDGVLRYCPRTG
jgi:uroporphyrinogen-III synthase